MQPACFAFHRCGLPYTDQSVSVLRVAYTAHCQCAVLVAWQHWFSDAMLFALAIQANSRLAGCHLQFGRTVASMPQSGGNAWRRLEEVQEELQRQHDATIVSIRKAEARDWWQCAGWPTFPRCLYQWSLYSVTVTATSHICRDDTATAAHSVSWCPCLYMLVLSCCQKRECLFNVSWQPHWPTAGARENF